MAELVVEPTDGTSRRREPVTCGIPWPRGGFNDVSHLIMRDDRGEIVPLQARCLDRWPDGSVRWTLLDWQASVTTSSRYQAEVTSGPSRAGHEAPKVTTTVQPGNGVEVDTGPARFRLIPDGPIPFRSVEVDGASAIDRDRTRFAVEDRSGIAHEPTADRVDVIEAGSLRTVVRLEGHLLKRATRPSARFVLDLHFFAGSATVRFELTIHNPNRAGHPGGCWDLGNGGSIYLKDVSLTLALAAAPGDLMTFCSPSRDAQYRAFGDGFELYQDSSGGENWESRNHVNRNGIVPNKFRGYRLRSGGREEFDLRATPAAIVRGGKDVLGLAIQHFWENFPKAIEASGDTLTLRLFPRQYADVHEIQGGEQKTHVFFAAFKEDGVTDTMLDWCRAPLLPHPTPSWYCSTGAVPYLVPWEEDRNSTYLSLVRAAVDGDDTFERKREVIDEYGWRHFGDVYGDHEAIFREGSPPLVSHYNNQYDNLAGFTYQFLRTGDRRWWQLMDDLARHVVDIDIYHTTRDRSAYNQGLFWHTCHYVDADTGTHRSYPSAGKVNGVNGGGPSGGHNYATGLMLHHFLTGDPRSREAAVGLARWVIDMDDGRKTIYRWLDRGFHGHATASGSPLYHGPGRAPANSIGALIDGHQLTGEPKFLEKAEQIIRRCVHPGDDIPSLDLLDAENKWFYTMFLQALGKYLAYKEQRGSSDLMYAYARESLLHYARWMADHERPYLDRPEILEYPTETWAAQDIRKSDVFQFAAMHASVEERDRFLERSRSFFNSSTATLAGMPTRTLARPVVLMLVNGYMYSYFNNSINCDKISYDFGVPEVFIPQKTRAIRRAKRLISAILIVFASLVSLAVVAWAMSLGGSR